MPLAARPTFAAARAICSRTRSIFSEIEFIVEAATFFRWTPIICLLRCLAQAPLQQQRLLCRRCALQSSSPKFHRPKCGNGEDIAGHMCGAHASVGRGRDRGHEKITRQLQDRDVYPTETKLLVCLDRGTALLSGVVHAVRIYCGERGE